MLAQDDAWEPVTGADTLREFMSGLTAERALPGGGVARGEYNADGTGVLHSWGESYPRTWEVEGEDRLCISSEYENACYELEKSTMTPDLYRVRAVVSGEVFEFTATEGGAVATGPPGEPGSKGGAAAVSASETAAKLANPNAVIGTLNTNLDVIAYDGNLPGASSETSFTLGFQPSLPYPLGEGRNLFVRPLVPIIFSQPVPGPDGFESVGVELGNIGFDAVLGFSLEGGKVVLVGAAGSLPTSTDDAVGSDQWLLGPGLVFGSVKKWGVLAVLVSHPWDVGGGEDFDTSITSGQYIYSILLKDGWSIAAQPPFSYNHETTSENALSFALGIGVGKTAIPRGRPWKLSAQYWHFVERAETFGASNQLRIMIGPVVNLPWGG